MTTKYKQQKQQDLKGSDSGSKSIQDYSFKYCDVLGKGNFSTVYKAIHSQNKSTVAIKVVELASLKSEKLAQLLNSEIKIIKKLNHKNIVRCYEVLTSLNNCYIITELCEEGDLETKLKKKGGCFQQKEIYSIVKDIYEGLSYLAKENIVHRDLKISNIFLKDGSAKIADFGFAKITKQSFTDLSIGSPLYMSPEGFLKNTYGRKTDVWAFGILLYQLTHGQTPFHNCKNQQDLGSQLAKQLKIEDLKPQLSQSLKSLILRCLDCNENTRIQIQDIKDTPFMKKTYCLAQSLKNYNDLLSGVRDNRILSTVLNGKIQRSTSLFTPINDKLNNISKINSPVHIGALEESPKQTHKKIPIKNQNESKKDYNFITNSNFPYDNTSKTQLKDLVNSNHQSRSPLNYKPTTNKVNHLLIKNEDQKSKHTNKKLSESYRHTHNFSNNFDTAKQSSQNIQSTLIEKSKNSQSLSNFAENYINWLKSPLSKKRESQLSSQYFQRVNLEKKIVQKPIIEKTIMFPRTLLFGEALGLLHYCRLCFKFVNLEQFKQYSKYAKWIISILQELLKKVQSKNIISDSTKASKQAKFKDVLKEYIIKYCEHFNKKQNYSSYNDTMTSSEILYILKEHYDQIDKNLAHKLSKKYLTFAYYALILCEQTNKIRVSEQIGDFTYFASGFLQEMLSEKSPPVTMQLYISTRRERTF